MYRTTNLLYEASKQACLHESKPLQPNIGNRQLNHAFGHNCIYCTGCCLTGACFFGSACSMQTALWRHVSLQLQALHQPRKHTPTLGILESKRAQISDDVTSAAHAPRHLPRYNAVTMGRSCHACLRAQVWEEHHEHALLWQLQCQLNWSSI